MMLILLIIVFVAIVSLGIVYKIQTSPVDSSDKTVVELDIPKGSAKQIGQVLEDNDLIRSAKFFQIYVKLFKPGELYAGLHKFSKSMNYEEIFEELNKKPTENPDQISIKFKSGVSMRQTAEIIAENTNNSYDDVINKSNDVDYIKKLIDKYWFITEEVLDDQIYYKLEGYLYPDTYYFKNKDVTVEEIFEKLLDKMGQVLEPFKQQIEENELTVHQILTLASIVEKESGKYEDGPKVARVFLNRLAKNMNLGSDVTCYYALQIDNAKKYVEENGRGSIDYSVQNPYNTRNQDGSMNGKLPIGPISTITDSCIEAVLFPDNTDPDILYFISNIETKETWFYSNYSDFTKKKAELDSVNKGL